MLGARSFSGLPALSSLTLGKVRFLSAGVFDGLSLREISFSGSMQEWTQTVSLSTSLFDGSAVERVICTDGTISVIS